MKQYILLFCATFLMACGSSAPKDEHAGHDHSKEESQEGHNHAAEESHEGHDHAAEEAKAEATGEHNHEGEISLSTKQATELKLTFETIEAANFTAAIPTSGMIEPSTSDNWTVAATSSGVVEIVRSDLSVGAAVAKGTALFRIKSDNLAGDNLATKVDIARAELSKAKANFERVTALYAKKLTTGGEMEQSKMELAAAELTFLNLSRPQVVTAPGGGFVTGLMVSNGSYVSQGQELATISASKKLVLVADVTSRYFDRLSQISGANFITPYNGKRFSVKELGGSLISRGAATGAGSYSVPVRFAIDNRSGLVPGSSVEVFLLMGEQKGVLSVPSAALTEEQGAYYIYIKTCKESYRKQHVTIGASNGQRTIITSGLAVGETVVTAGAYYVRLASMSSAIPHGHAH